MCRYEGSSRAVVGLNRNDVLLGQLLLNSDLTFVLASVRGGRLLLEVGSYIELKHDLRQKYDAELVRGSKAVFDMVGAEL